MALFNRTRAARVEKLARRVARSRKYDQLIIGSPGHGCGTPGCLIGHSRYVFPRRREDIHRFLFGEKPSLDNALAYEVWNRDAFSPHGCDDAQQSGKKAAKFIRQMAKDLKAALAAEKAA